MLNWVDYKFFVAVQHRILAVFMVVVSLTASAQKPIPAGESMASEDWAAIIKTYEAQISQGGATSAALHNLALARFKNGEPEQAVAVWLAAWEKAPADLEIQAGLFGALEHLDMTVDALNLAAQGPWLAFIASQGRSVFQKVLVTSVGVLALILILCFLARKNRKLLFGLLISAGANWGFVGLWYHGVGSWGAVVNPGGESLRSSQRADSIEIAKVKPGTPIYVTSSTFEPKLFVHTADGFSGWIDALGVRVVRSDRL